MNEFKVPGGLHSLKILYTDRLLIPVMVYERETALCEHEIIRKRYRIPREISACIVNDPRLLCFTCRKVRCAFKPTSRLGVVDTENLAVYLVE